MSTPHEDNHHMPLRRRLFASLATAAVLATAPGLAVAHAELVSSDPPADAVLTEPPGEVVLTFGGELDPDGSGLMVADANGVEVGSGGVDLDVADRNMLRADVSIVEDGSYTVTWTAVSIDGHAETGTVTFSVDAATDAAAPDTALRRPTTALTTTGLVLVALSLILALRRRSRTTR